MRTAAWVFTIACRPSPSLSGFGREQCRFPSANENKKIRLTETRSGLWWREQSTDLKYFRTRREDAAKRRVAFRHSLADNFLKLLRNVYRSYSWLLHRTCVIDMVRRSVRNVHFLDVKYFRYKICSSVCNVSVIYPINFSHLFWYSTRLSARYRKC